MMKKESIIIGFILAITILSGCGGQDAKRAKALHAMPVLWESELVVADSKMIDMKNFVAMYDSYDASLAQAWSKDKFTDDYIPESVMAFKSESYRDKSRTITIEMGDIVDVLKQKQNNTGKDVCLIRTDNNTYAWLYAFHLLDENGDRLGNFR
jgi:hypothetical protein